MKHLAFLSILLLASCASHPVIVRPISPALVEPLEPIRYKEMVRAYQVGRYVDPAHPEVLNEEHPIYRLEASARWNLHPGSATDAPALNPPIDAAFAPPPTNDVILAEVNRQREITKEVMQEAVKLAESYQQLEPVIQEMKNVARNDALLHAQLTETEQRILKLEKEFERVTASPVPATNDVSNSVEATKP